MSPKAAAKSLFTAEQKKVLAGWTKQYPYRQMGLIEALRSVQEWHRCVTVETARYVADLFELPFNHVWGVVTFFPTFTLKPTGKYRVGLCHGLTCWLAGSDQMAEGLERALGVPEKETSPDGKFSWEEMECLGACDFAPALQVNDRLKGKATEELISGLAKDPSKLAAAPRPEPPPAAAAERAEDPAEAASKA